MKAQFYFSSVLADLWKPWTGHVVDSTGHEFGVGHVVGA